MGFNEDLSYSKTLTINNVYTEIIKQEFPNSTLDLCVTIDEERNGVDGWIRMKNRKASVQFKVLYGTTDYFNYSILPFETEVSFDNFKTSKNGWLYHTNSNYFVYIRATPDQSDYVYWFFNTRQLLDKVKSLVSANEVKIKTNKENTAKLAIVGLDDIKGTLRISK